MRHRHSFFEFFPPPEFFSLPASGFDISDRVVRFAELKRHGSHLRLARWGQKALPEGAITKGELKNADVVREILRDIAVEQGIQFVCVSLPEQLSYVVSLVLPRLSGRELRESIALQLPEHIPFDPTKTVFDYTTSICSGDDGGELITSVTAAHADTVAQYSGIFESAGFTVLSVETESSALERSLLSESNDLCAARMVLDVGATKTSLFIESGGVIHLTSTIPLGGDALSGALARALSISFDEARLRKEAQGIGSHRMLSGEDSPELFSHILPVLSALSDEIRKHYVYWNTHHAGDVKKNTGAIKEVVVSGGEVNVHGFTESLAWILGTPLIVGNPWTNIADIDDYVPEIPRSEAHGYAAALGLALRSFTG